MVVVTTFWLTVEHDQPGGHDFQVLATIRRTLLGLASHGFITDVQTYSSTEVTSWSYHPGTEDGGEILAGLVDTAKALAPKHWRLIDGVTDG
jgi:hypothetical protein